MRTSGHPITQSSTTIVRSSSSSTAGGNTASALLALVSPETAYDLPEVGKDRDRGRMRRNNRAKDRKRFDPRDSDDNWS